jgi:hypothetical protein
VITENLDLFLADFGESASIDGGAAVQVIFDAPYAELPGAGPGMSDAQPSVRVKTSDLPDGLLADEEPEDSVVYLSEAATRRPGSPQYYRITEAQPDATGAFTRLQLRAAPPPPPPPPPAPAPAPSPAPAPPP